MNLPELQIEALTDRNEVSPSKLEGYSQICGAGHRGAQSKNLPDYAPHVILYLRGKR